MTLSKRLSINVRHHPYTLAGFSVYDVANIRKKVYRQAMHKEKNIGYTGFAIAFPLRFPLRSYCAGFAIRHNGKRNGRRVARVYRRTRRHGIHFRIMKGHVLHCKRRQNARQKATFHGVKGGLLRVVRNFVGCSFILSTITVNQ